MANKVPLELKTRPRFCPVRLTGKNKVMNRHFVDVDNDVDVDVDASRRRQFQIFWLCQII
jgi:hypothetical protein